MSRLTQTKFSGTHGDGNIIFPVQLTTSRIGNLTRLIHTLLYVMTIHTYCDAVKYSLLYCILRFRHARRLLDYSYHSNYSLERQRVSQSFMATFVPCPTTTSCALEGRGCFVGGGLQYSVTNVIEQLEVYFVGVCLEGVFVSHQVRCCAYIHFVTKGSVSRLWYPSSCIV